MNPLDRDAGGKGFAKSFTVSAGIGGGWSFALPWQLLLHEQDAAVRHTNITIPIFFRVLKAPLWVRVMDTCIVSRLSTGLGPEFGRIDLRFQARIRPTTGPKRATCFNTVSERERNEYWPFLESAQANAWLIDGRISCP